MNPSQRRFAFIFIFLLIATAWTVTPARAQGPSGGTIPTGTTIESDLALAQPDVSVDGNVDGDLFVVGQNVTLNGNVTGSVFVIADRATLRGQVGGSVYAVAANLNIDSTARIARSVYALALSLLTAPESAIGRDLRTLAIGAQLRGTVTRDTHAVIGPLEILRLLLAQVEALNLFQVAQRPTPTAIAMSTAASSQRAWSCLPFVTRATSAMGGILGSGLECLLNPPAAPLQQAQTPTDAAAIATKWGLHRARDFVTLALIGLILLFALPRRLENWSAPIPAHPLATPGIGLLAALNGFLLAALLTLVVITIGIIFQALSLSTLALLTWALGLATTAALFWLFILILFFISQIVFVYWSARALLHRFAPQAKLHRALVLLLALLIFVLLAGIPLVGAIIAIAAALYGTGALVLTGWNRFSARRAKPNALSETPA